MDGTDTHLDPNRRKGRVLEDLVATLQSAGFDDVTVRKQLPAKNDPSRKREIDVLVGVPGPGQVLRVAFECRNRAEKVEAEDIGGFKDKLDDVGLAVPGSVFVTPTGFTSGAMARANELGIQPLIAEGLSSDRLRIAVRQAIAHNVFYMLWVHGIQPLNRFGRADLPPGRRMFHADFEENLADLGSPTRNMQLILGRLADIWCAGLIPPTLGLHGGAFRVPDGFQIHPEQEPLVDGIVWMSLRVKAAVFSRPGTSQATSLRHAETDQTTQSRVEWTFPPFEGGKSDALLESDDQLRAHLESQEVEFRLVHNWQVPRVQFNEFWWPVSREALERAATLSEAGEELSFENVELGSLARAWLEDPRLKPADEQGSPPAQEEE